MPLQQMPGKVTGGVHRLHDKAQGGKGGVSDHSLDSASGSDGPLMSHSVITKRSDLGLKPCLPSYYQCGLEISLELSSIPANRKQPLSLCRRIVK